MAANWRTFDRLTQATTAAVVKADGYGTGMVEAATALHEAGCATFFVATPGEGVALRRALPDVSILVLAGLVAGSESLYQNHDLEPVLNSLDQVERWGVVVGRRPDHRVTVHVDTGINRLGVHHGDVDRLEELLRRGGLELGLVVSHLACADDPAHPLNRLQLQRFQRIVAAFPGVKASLCGSAGVLLGEEYHFDLIRPGVGLFGGNPVPSRPTVLHPVATVRAPVLQIHRLEPSESVGYGALYRPGEPRILATVGAGYADGFPRALSGVGVAVMGTAEVPYVGRVSMDSIVLDVTGVDPLADWVELIGSRVTVDRVAELAGTIPNEVLTGLGGRLVRRHVQDPLRA